MLDGVGDCFSQRHEHAEASLGINIELGHLVFDDRSRDRRDDRHCGKHVRVPGSLRDKSNAAASSRFDAPPSV
ncbi:MAG TPA: hypothetical protein VMT95_01730 [Candidatus Binatia bacterium]|nr:hypothetical protein [Candidatus Binatia bacterium]